MTSEEAYRQQYQQMLQRLRSSRERAGLTQQQVADFLGRPQSYVSKCEAGERRIDVIELVDFVDLYKTSLESVARGSNE